LTRCFARFGLDPAFWFRQRAFNQFREAFERDFLVSCLATGFLRLDNDDAIGSDALVAPAEQSLPALVGQARGARYVKAQLHGGRDLIDVLPAGALGAERREDQFAVWNTNVVRNS